MVDNSNLKRKDCAGLLYRRRVDEKGKYKNLNRGIVDEGIEEGLWEWFNKDGKPTRTKTY
jgi:hypothetical protein